MVESLERWIRNATWCLSWISVLRDRITPKSSRPFLHLGSIQTSDRGQEVNGSFRLITAMTLVPGYTILKVGVLFFEDNISCVGRDSFIDDWQYSPKTVRTCVYRCWCMINWDHERGSELTTATTTLIETKTYLSVVTVTSLKILLHISLIGYRFCWYMT